MGYSGIPGVNLEEGQIKAFVDLPPFNPDATMQKICLTLLSPSGAADEKPVTLTLSYALVRSLSVNTFEDLNRREQEDQEAARKGIFRPTTMVLDLSCIQPGWFNDDIKESAAIVYFFGHDEKEMRKKVDLNLNQAGDAPKDEAVVFTAGYPRNAFSAGVNRTGTLREKVNGLSKSDAPKYRSLESFLFKQVQMALRNKGKIFDGSRTETLYLLAQQNPDLIREGKFDLSVASDYLKNNRMKVPLGHLRDNGLLNNSSVDYRPYLRWNPNKECYEVEFPVMPDVARISLLQKMEEWNQKTVRLSFLKDKLSITALNKNNKKNGELIHPYFCWSETFGGYLNRYSAAGSKKDNDAIKNYNKRGHRRAYVDSPSQQVWNECLMTGKKLYQITGGYLSDKVPGLRARLEEQRKRSLSYFMFAPQRGECPVVPTMNTEEQKTIQSRVVKHFGEGVEFLPFYKERCALRVGPFVFKPADLWGGNLKLRYFLIENHELLRRPPEITQMRKKPGSVDKNNITNPKHWYLELAFSCAPQVLLDMLGKPRKRRGASRGMLTLSDLITSPPFPDWQGIFSSEGVDVVYHIPAAFYWSSGGPVKEWITIGGYWIQEKGYFPQGAMQYDREARIWRMRLPSNIENLRDYQNKNSSVIKSIEEGLKRSKGLETLCQEGGSSIELWRIAPFYHDKQGHHLGKPVEVGVWGVDANHVFNGVFRCGIRIECLGQISPSLAFLIAQAALRHLQQRIKMECLQDEVVIRVGNPEDFDVKLDGKEGDYPIPVEVELTRGLEAHCQLMGDAKQVFTNFFKAYSHSVPPWELVAKWDLTDGEVEELEKRLSREITPKGITPWLREQAIAYHGKALNNLLHVVFRYQQLWGFIISLLNDEDVYALALPRWNAYGLTPLHVFTLVHRFVYWKDEQGKKLFSQVCDMVSQKGLHQIWNVPCKCFFLKSQHCNTGPRMRDFLKPSFEMPSRKSGESTQYYFWKEVGRGGEDTMNQIQLEYTKSDVQNQLLGTLVYPWPRLSIAYRALEKLLILDPVSVLAILEAGNAHRCATVLDYALQIALHKDLDSSELDKNATFIDNMLTAIEKLTDDQKSTWHAQNVSFLTRHEQSAGTAQDWKKDFWGCYQKLSCDKRSGCFEATIAQRYLLFCQQSKREFSFKLV